MTMQLAIIILCIPIAFGILMLCAIASCMYSDGYKTEARVVAVCILAATVAIAAVFIGLFGAG